MNVAELMLVFSGDAKGAVGAVKEVKGQLGELNEKSEESHNKFASILGGVATGIATAGFGLLTAAVGFGVEAANKDQVAMAALNQTLKDAGQTWTPQLTDEFDKLEKKQQSLGFTNDQTAASVQKLVQAGVPLAQAMTTVGTASDLARAKNIDLATATDALIKGAQGQGRELKTLGIILPPTISSSTALAAAQQAVAKDTTALATAIKDHGEKSTQATKAQTTLAAAQTKLATETKAAQNPMANLGQVVDQVSGKVQGQADAYSKTLPGAIAAMKASFEGVMVTIGQKVAPLLASLAQWFTDNSQTIGNVFSTALDVLGTAFTVVSTAVGVLFSHMNIILPILLPLIAAFVAWKVAMAIGNLLQFAAAGLAMFQAGLEGVTLAEGVATPEAYALGAAIDFMLGPVGLIILGIAALIAIVVLIVTHFQTFKDILGQVGNFIKNFFVGAFNLIKQVIGDVLNWLKSNWPLILAIFGGPLGLLIALVVTYFTQIKNFFVSIFNDIKGFVTGAVHDIVGVFQSLGDGIGKVWDAISGAAKTAWDFVVGIVKGAVNTVIGWVNAFIGLLDALQIHMHIPEGIPLIGGKGFDWDGLNIPKIPKLAFGAIAQQATVALVGDAIGGEAIMNRPQARDFAAWAGVAAGGQGGGDTHVTVNQPTSNVDVVTAIRNQRWLDRMSLRGIAPPREFPAGAPA